MIAYLGARLAASIVDAVWALMLTGLLLWPVLVLVPAEAWTRTNPVPLLWALVMILMSLGFQGRTPGKRWMRLEVRGAGCLACREIRRFGWALVLGGAALLGDVLPGLLAQGLQVLALALFGAAFAWPLLTRAPEFPHNRATGLAVAQRR